MIAALFVEHGGPYYGLPQVDPWDEARDARLYRGPHSVVAHPPCQLWVNFAALNFKRYGGEHNRPGNDGGCFASAVDSVIRYGGVLEHPAGSRAFERHGIDIPLTGGGWWPNWPDHYWTCEVWQSAYGHRARKRTWLIYSGKRKPAELNWEHRQGTHRIGTGWPDCKGKRPPVLSGKAASATPPAFRDELIGLAESAR